jgi:hypothetical protein
MIENKVSSNSKLITVDLTELLKEAEIVEIDIAPMLWQGIVLKEAEFRNSLKEMNLAVFEAKHVIVKCTADAIVPTWAFMLLCSKLFGIARSVVFAEVHDLDEQKALLVIENLELSRFENKNVVIKGCSDLKVTANVYVQLQHKLQPIANRIMFGEPCSTVPIYKK